MPKAENLPVPAEPYIDNASYLEDLVELSRAVVERFAEQQNRSTDDLQHTAVVEHLIREERHIKDEIAARVPSSST